MSDQTITPEETTTDTTERVKNVVCTAASIYVGVKCGSMLYKRLKARRVRRQEEKLEAAIVAAA